MPFTIAGFLMAIAGSLAARVITSLGIGWVSYTGIMAAMGAVATYISAAWAGSSPVIQLLLYAGMGHAVGITLSALTTRAMMYGFAWLGKAIT